MDSVRSTAIRQGDAIAQSTDQRKIPHRKTQSQTAQHIPAVMTEAAMRIPSSAFKPEPKPEHRKTGGWIACAAAQSVKAMQSPINRPTQNPEPLKAQSHPRNTVPPP
ncbi:hypothetical protein [Pseudomonas sp. MS19]|uniref:hypothetical protein n=1 Tax=Pseudomonas sp. MS19 TaxID=2579939 RepID=UPI0015629709|nr:hypothetical protein [Pseudomonas sp. MS19]NRH26983.1 hypothetical protein [Pseudomonas sp. MS19]